MAGSTPTSYLIWEDPTLPNKLTQRWPCWTLGRYRGAGAHTHGTLRPSGAGREGREGDLAVNGLAGEVWGAWIRWTGPTGPSPTP